MEDQTPFVKEEWAYTGRRVANGGKSLGHEYVDAAGADYFYLKPLASTTIIGGLYEIEVQRGSEKLTAKRTGKYLGRTVEDSKDVNKWRAEDAAASLEVQQRSLGAKLSGPRLETMTIAELKNAVRRLPSFRRRAVAATVLSMLLDQGGC